MKKYNTVLFDLDGTLTDPALGITNSVAHALRKWGKDVPERSELYKFIGPPLVDSFMKYYGFTREEAEKSVEYYREHFATKGLFENSVYDGVRDMLEKLKARGKRLVVATSKPEVYSKRILEHFCLDTYFDFLAGATLDSSRVKKADVIGYALDICGICDVSDVIMIGDREHDIIGAKENGLKSIGVLYGYGDENELFWIPLTENFFDLNRFAGEGNIGHMMLLVDMEKDKIFA